MTCAATLTALGLIAEIGDVASFGHPRELAARLGITPSEYSSGDHQHRGRITNAGNRHARRLLIEPAWRYRHAQRHPSSGPTRRARLAGPSTTASPPAPPDRHGKRSTVANVAIACELIGFLRAALTDQPLRATHDLSPVNHEQRQEAAAASRPHHPPP